MRILHTSDWHVGKTLRGRSRADEHRAVLAEIASIAADGDIDLVLVAGDLFDTAAPTPEAEEIVYTALLELARSGAEVVVVAGNHDNPRRLRAVGPLLGLTRIHALAELARPDRGGVLELETRSGERARVARLPFVSQRGIVRADELMAADADEHAQQYAARMTGVVAALCGTAVSDAVHLLVAHAMVHGAETAGSERAAHTVYEYSVPATAFPGHLHYVALGHLHRPQRVDGPCPIAYAGSPLQLDFGEADDAKSVRLIEAVPGEPVRIESIELAAGRRLRRVCGTVAELTERAEQGDLGDVWLAVDIDEPPRPGLADEVRRVLPDAVDVRVVRRAAAEDAGARPARIGRSPHELFAEYLTEHDADDEAVRALFAELLEEVHASDPA